MVPPTHFIVHSFIALMDMGFSRAIYFYFKGSFLAVFRYIEYYCGDMRVRPPGRFVFWG